MQVPGGVRTVSGETVRSAAKVAGSDGLDPYDWVEAVTA